MRKADISVEECANVLMKSKKCGKECGKCAECV